MVRDRQCLCTKTLVVSRLETLPNGLRRSNLESIRHRVFDEFVRMFEPICSVTKGQS